MSLILEIGIKTWLFSLDYLALTVGIVVALLTGMTGSATPEYSLNLQIIHFYVITHVHSYISKSTKEMTLAI